MTSQPLEPRVSALEQALLDLARAQAHTQAQLDQLSANSRALDAQQARTQVQLDQLSTETRTFQADTRAFEARITAAVDRIEAWGARMDARADRIDRQWGELANKMGTLTEDIVLPGIPTVFRTLFGADGTIDLAVRVRRRHRTDPGRDEEFDAVTSAGDVVLVAESKSSLRPEHIPEFLEKLSRSRGFLPEADGKRLVGLLASFRLDPSLVAAGEKQGLVMVGLGSGLLQVLNTRDFVPRAF